MSSNQRSVAGWAATLGFSAVVSLLVLQAGLHWEWNFMMDEIGFNSWIRGNPNFLGELQGFIRSMWFQGRFFPMHQVGNFLKWTFLPGNPDIFRWCNLVILASAVVFGALAVTRQATERKFWLLFAIGLAVLQRPLLDVIALSSITEGNVILFFGLGLLLFPRHPIGYRIAFAFCAMSKELGPLAFLASGVAHGVRRRRLSSAAVFDLAAFAVFMAVVFKAKSTGVYASGFSLFGPDVLKQVAFGVLKVGFGLVPLVLCIVLSRSWRKAAQDLLSGSEASSIALICLLFGLSYLYVSSAWNTSGYLSIPAAFALYLGLTSLVVRVCAQLPMTLSAKRLMGVAFLLCLVVSLVRYQRFAAGINEPAAALRTLFFTSAPRLVLFNAHEPRSLAEQLGHEAGADSVEFEMVTPESPASVKKFLRKKGSEVVVFELTQNFGKYSDSMLTALTAAAGGWRQISDRGVYRLFYQGAKPAN